MPQRAQGHLGHSFARSYPVHLRQRGVAPLCAHCVSALPPHPRLREAKRKRKEERKDRTKREMPKGEARRLWRGCTHTWKGAKEENTLKGTTGCLLLLPHTQDNLTFSGLIG